MEPEVSNVLVVLRRSVGDPRERRVAEADELRILLGGGGRSTTLDVAVDELSVVQELVDTLERDV